MTFPFILLTGVSLQNNSRILYKFLEIYPLFLDLFRLRQTFEVFAIHIGNFRILRQ